MLSGQVSLVHVIPVFLHVRLTVVVSFENCITIPNDPSWGTLMVGSNGNLYVGASGSLDFVVARSTNAQISGQTVTWDMATYVNLDGYITYGIGPNPDGLGGQTSIAIDTSGGAYQGNIYLLCSVERISNSDPSRCYVCPQHKWRC